MRADLSLPAVRDLVRKHPDRLSALAGVGADTATNDLRDASDLVKFFVESYAESLKRVPRMQRAQASVANMYDAQILRSLWTCAYWHQQEFKNCAAWGFSSTCG